MDNVEDIFQGESGSACNNLNSLAPLVEELAILVNQQKAAEAEANSLKKKVSILMSSLYSQLMVNQCQNGHKFDSGINVKPVLKESVFKAGGVQDEELFEYLNSQSLGHIIKPTVHWKTLTSVMLGERELGRELPEDMFTVKAEQRVQFVGNGHIQFLEKTL